MAVIPLRRGRSDDDPERAAAGPANDPPTLEDLLRAVGLGDDAAFATLYDAVAPAVFGTCRRVLRDPGQAEEVAQEVLLEVWRHAPRYDATLGRPMTWILTIAHRRAVDRVRASQASLDRDAKSAASSTERDHDVVAEAVELRAEQREVRRALATLTLLQQQAITLAYYQGYTHTEIAAALDVPLGTAKTRIRDGLIRLRDAMGVPS